MPPDSADRSAAAEMHHRPHMDRDLGEELGRLREQLLDMAARVEGMLQAAFEAFFAGSAERAAAVVRMDREVDLLEQEIDERCLRVLARRQPVAFDLRFVTAVLKWVVHLERLGDLAESVAERALERGEGAAGDAPPGLRRAADKALAMVHAAGEALATSDPARAHGIIRADAGVDELHAAVTRELRDRLDAAPALVRQILPLLSVSRSVERAGDLATNLAEQLVFLYEAEGPRRSRHSDPAAGSQGGSGPPPGERTDVPPDSSMAEPSR